MSKYLYGSNLHRASYCGALLLSTLGLVGLVGLGGCKKSEGGSPTVAGNLGTVDGEPITYEEFYGYLQRKPVIFAAVQGRQVQVQVADTLGVQTMRDLVQQKLLMEVAKDEGVVPTKEEIDQELDRRKKQNPDYITNMERAGLSLDEIKHDAMLGLASEKIQTKGVTVSEAEAKKYITDNKTAFSTPPQAKLLLIVVKTDADKAKADTDLKSGQSFAAVAMKYSTMPNARQSGGAFPVSNIAQMPPILQKLVKDTPEDKATPWQKDHSNWVKFYVEKKSAAKPVAITPDLLDAVKRELAKKKSPNAPDFQKRMLAKIRASKVTISVPIYQDGWNAYVASNQTKK